MKTLWNVVSFLAVVHLMAICLFVLWLWQTQRLDGERVQTLREVLRTPIPEAEQIAREIERQEEAQREQEDRERRETRMPTSSASIVADIDYLEEIKDRMRRSLEDERRMMADQIQMTMRNLETRESELAAEREAWERSIAEHRSRLEDEQFAKAVRQYESVPARQGKDMLLELIDQGEVTQAVAYLDAMNARAASKILAEFRTPDEIRLATQLLEELRRFGLDAEPTTESSDVDALAHAP